VEHRVTDADRSSAGPQAGSADDDRAIRRVLALYARGIDRLDLELVRACYWDDATDERAGYSGAVDGFIEYARSALRNVERSNHIVANTVIDFVGNDSAYVESYCLSVDRIIVDPTAPVTSLTTLRYVDRFDHRAGRWAISRRRMIVDVNVTIPDGAATPMNLAGFVGTRDQNDHLYVARREWFAGPAVESDRPS
jgi:hypothetical protein